MAMSHLSLLRPLLCQTLLRQARRLLSVSTSVRNPLLLLPPSGSRQPALCTRFYATKKAKAKSKGKPTKVNLNAALVEDIISLDELEAEMNAVVSALKEDFSRSLSIRTTPGAFDHIVVTTADGKFPLNQLGQVSMKSPQMITVNMSSFPEATAAATRALRESSMNLNPDVDGTIIQVPVPKVTREHRENLVKAAKKMGNKAKDSMRKVRSNAVTQVKREKEGHSEDTIYMLEKQIQQMAEKFIADIDKHLAAKSKELLG